MSSRNCPRCGNVCDGYKSDGTYCKDPDCGQAPCAFCRVEMDKDCICVVRGNVRYPEQHCPLLKNHNVKMEEKTLTFCFCDGSRG